MCRQEVMTQGSLAWSKHGALCEQLSLLLSRRNTGSSCGAVSNLTTIITQLPFLRAPPAGHHTSGHWVLMLSPLDVFC